jgi:glycosyltransferase involved in cell wall biosynthesis
VVGISPHPGEPRGLLTFFQAARRLLDGGLDPEFVITGPLDEEDELRRMAAHFALADRTTFGDPASVGPAYWSVFRAYCGVSPRPSVGPEIGQAMAHGVPIVASDVPGLRRWVQHDRTGRLVPPGDPVALADTLRDLLTDPLLARRLGEEARQWVVEHCSPERRYEALVAVYERILMHRADDDSRAAGAISSSGGRARADGGDTTD